jgi:hypothetical protein
MQPIDMLADIERASPILGLGHRPLQRELGMPLQVASPILPESLSKKSIPVGPGSGRDS